MQGISNVDMSLSLFGERIRMPICMAPVGLQAMANTLAEMASAQGSQWMYPSANSFFWESGKWKMKIL